MKSICVFCGSSTGTDPLYAEAARRMGEAIVRRSLTLVYGGGRIGLMGEIARSVLENGGRAVGVIPEALLRKELAYDDLTELHVVAHDARAQADDGRPRRRLVAMPGGYGTFEEFCEVLTWSQLGIHHKPCALLNVNGYYDGMLALFDHAVAESFVRPLHRSMVLAAGRARRPAHAMERYEPRSSRSGSTSLAPEAREADRDDPRPLHEPRRTPRRDRAIGRDGTTACRSGRAGLRSSTLRFWRPGRSPSTSARTPAIGCARFVVSARGWSQSSRNRISCACSGALRQRPGSNDRARRRRTHAWRSDLARFRADATVTTLSARWATTVAHDPSFRSVTWVPGPRVQVTTLDALIATHGLPAFVKLDVEASRPRRWRVFRIPCPRCRSSTSRLRATWRSPASTGSPRWETTSSTGPRAKRNALPHPSGSAQEQPERSWAAYPPAPGRATCTVVCGVSSNARRRVAVSSCIRASTGARGVSPGVKPLATSESSKSRRLAITWTGRSTRAARRPRLPVLMVTKHDEHHVLRRALDEIPG